MPAVSKLDDFRMPAEWFPHAATWLAWPHNASDWTGKLQAIQWAFIDIIRQISARETVRLVVQSSEEWRCVEEMLTRIGASLNSVEFFEAPTNRNWLRDSGPIFVRGGESGCEIAVVRFRFNGWALYPEWANDDLLPPRIADILSLRLVEAYRDNGARVVLEGGSIDVNGNGSLIATEQCLLDQEIQVRNPEMGRAELEQIFSAYLGVTNVIWLGEGIEGDETHGHVDDICRFVAAGRVVACRESNPNDSNYRSLEENWERLQNMQIENGAKLDVVALPMPAPIFLDGARLPASYANFFVFNEAVLVPTFNDPRDFQALGILSEQFSDHQVIGVHSLDLLAGGGAIHCLTQQQPQRRV